MPEINITENGVSKLLQSLHECIQSSIRPIILKELSTELAPILTLLFKASLHQQYKHKYKVYFT